MASHCFKLIAAAWLAVASCSVASADEAVRITGAVDAYSDVAVAGDAYDADVPYAEREPVEVAFGHHRRACCGGADFSAAFNAYSTYQPGFYPRYAAGYGGYYGANYAAGYYYATPNPYGYYPNGMVWGSSGPTYGRPFPVWGSPSGIYDYRYQGWGSYGWGGWGGTGPAGWGYQGGFYW